MFISKLICFVIFITNLYESSCEISDKRLCVDEKCSVPVSRAKTILRYSSAEREGLSFAPHQEVVIFSKEAGSEKNLWGGEVNGKRGYFPKDFVKEYKILNKPGKLVDTKPIQESQVPNTSEENVKPDKTLDSFEFVEGTKLYLNPAEIIDAIDSQDNFSLSEEPKEKTLKEEFSIDEFYQNEANESNVASSTNTNKPDHQDPSNEPKNEIEINNAEIFEINKEISQPSTEIKPKSSEETFSPQIPDIRNDTVIDENDNSPTNSKPEISQTNGNIEAKDENENNMDGNNSETNTGTIFPNSENSPLNLVLSDSGGSKDENKQTESSVKETFSPEIPDIKSDTVIEENDNSPTNLNLELSLNIANTEENDEFKKNKDEIIPETKPGSIISNIENNLLDLTPNDAIDSRNEEKQTESNIKNEDNVIQENSSASKDNSAVNGNLDSQNVKPKMPEESLEIKVPEIPIIPKFVSNDPHLQSDIPEPKLYQNLDEIKNRLNSLEKSDNSKTEPDSNPPPMLPTIFPPYSGNLFPQGATFQEQANEETFMKKNISETEEKTVNYLSIDTNISSVTNNSSNENEEETLKSDELSIADLTNSFDQTPQILDLSNSLTNSKYSGVENEQGHKNEDESNESSFEFTETQDSYASKYNNFEDINIPEDVSSSSEGFADDTSTSEEIVMKPPNVDQEYTEDVKEKESSGFFSIFTSVFDWSSSEDDKNENSAIDSILYYKEENLKCELNNGIMNNIDFKFWSLNSNVMVHLFTTIVVFITFLFFYISANKYRIESPLVAKINQLEKDLLIMMKEKETLVEKPMSERKSSLIDSEEFIQINQRLQEIDGEKEHLQVQLLTLKQDLMKKDLQIENLEKELETSTEVGMELNRIISEMLDPTANGSEKLKENVEQLQRQLQEQREVIKNISSRLNVKEVENAELLVEIEETRKTSSNLHQRIHELVEKVTIIEREKDTQQNALQNEIRLYQTNYNELLVKEEVFNKEVQILKSKLANSEREIDLKIKEINNLKESFKDISSMKNDNKKLNTVLDGISMKAEYDQMKSDIEKFIEELKQNQSEKVFIEKKYQNVVQELNELKKKHQETDKEKSETELKLEVLNNYFKKREAELQEEVLKYKAIWDTKEGEATSTTERFKLLQEEIENYKTQNDTLKQEILSQEIALKSQISVLEKKAHEQWVNARQSERKLEDARQEAAQLRNRLTFRQRHINEEMLQNGLDQNDSSMSSQPPLYNPTSPPLFYDNGRDQVTKSPLPGLPPFLPPPPGAPFVPPVPNLSGMPMPPPFMPPLPAGFPGDHRPPPLGRMSSPPIQSRYSPDTSAFSPYDRGAPSPIYDSEYGGGPYRHYSPYNSEDDRRGYASPSPVPRTKTRNSKNSFLPSNVNRSNESLEKNNSKKPNMV